MTTRDKLDDMCALEKPEFEAILLEHKLRIMAKMLYTGERISFGADAVLMEQAANEIERMRAIMRGINER